MKIDSSSNYQSVSCVLNNINNIISKRKKSSPNYILSLLFYASEKGMQNPRKKEKEKEISPIFFRQIEYLAF